MSNRLTTKFSQEKKIQGSVNRKELIGVLKGIIRQKHKVQRQIQRKYQTYQALEQYQENLKNRIRQLTVAVL